jgi:hypothetical protein
MNLVVKKGIGRALTVLIVLALLLTTVIMSNNKVGAYGPSTMYNSPSGAPAPGALYGRAMQASNGKMYATFEQYTSGTPVFPIYESTDNGQSWTQVGNVNDTHLGVGLRWEPFLYQLPQAIGSLSAGTFLCAGLAVPSNRAYMDIDLYKSTDSGRTWSYVSTIATGQSANCGSDPVWEPFLMVANNKLICYYSDERDAVHSQKLVHQTTTDGVNWSSSVDDVALSDSSQRPGMVVVAKMPNGSYIMTYEIVGMGGAYYKISSNPESWNATDKGTCFDSGGSSPYCVNLNGTIILSSAGNGNLYTNTNNGTGGWTQISSILGSCYSRCLAPLSNGRLFVIGAGWNGTGLNNVSYGDMAVSTTPVSYVKIVNCATGLNIDGYGYTTNGSNCNQYANSGSNNQQWALEISGSNYMLKNRATGLYLDGMGRTTNGSICGQWSNSGSNNQKWLRETAGSYYKFKNVATGLYLDGMGSTSNGATLCQWANSASNNQLWSITSP